MAEGHGVGDDHVFNLELADNTTAPGGPDDESPRSVLDDYTDETITIHHHHHHRRSAARQLQTVASPAIGVKLRKRGASSASPSPSPSSLSPSPLANNDLTVSASSLVSGDESLLEDRTTVADFLRQFRCYALMPQSSKVVVLDTRIPLRSCLQALEENDTDSAPLWDAHEQDFIGMITQTDLISLLLYFEKRVNPFGDASDSPPPTPRKIEPHVASQIVQELITMLDCTSVYASRSLIKSRSLPMLSMDPQDHLYEAVETLSKYKVHRMAVIDRADYSNSLLYILSPTRIIIFLMKVMPSKPQMFSYSLKRLSSVGTYRNLVTCSIYSTLVDVLRVIDRTHFASVPIVDDQGRLVDVFYKSMITHLSHLTLLSCFYKPIQIFLDSVRRTPKQRQFRVSLDDTLETVLLGMIDSRLRSVVVTDVDNKVMGIVALGDILRLFIV